MSDMKIQTGYNTKLKKPIFTELTYDFFVENLGWEWFFRYKDKTIDIAWRKENKNILYDFYVCGSTDNYGVSGQWLVFNSPEEFLEGARIDGKTLKEIWDDLEN